MADKTIKLMVDIQAQASNLQAEVNKMQKAFSALTGPEKLTEGITGTFSDLEKRLKQLKQYTENNELDLIDEKKAKEELKSIEKGYNDLLSKISNNKDKFTLAGASKEGKVLKQIIGDYNDKVAQGTKEIQAQEHAVKKLEGEIKRAQSLLDTKQQVKDNAIAERDRLKDEVDKLQSQIEQKQQSQINNGRSQAQNEAALHRTKAWIQLHNEENGLLKQLADAENKVTVATKNYNSQASKTETIVAENNVKLTEEKQKLDDLNSELSKLKVSELQAVKDTLVALSNKGEINLGFDPSSINSIEELQQKLQDIDNQDMSKVKVAIETLMTTIRNSKGVVGELKNGFDQSTEAGKQLAQDLDSFKTKITHFFGLANAVNLFKRAVRSAYNTVKDLDKVMTETAVVTSFDVGDMWKQLPEYTARANELGVSIHDAYEAATLYYQQGLKTNEVMAVSNETLKMARIAGLDAAEATDRMTNALRGFNMEITEANAQNINDVYSNLAAKTASNVDEISTAMTKVASLANNANMSFENTAAFLSQIIETTRESAETAGTALKTVIARFSEVKSLYSEGELLGDVEGEEIDVNKVSKALRTAGINLNEYLTGMKGLDEIFMELSAKWDSLDQVQQRYIATMAAGSRQQSRFIALMQDNARMSELVKEANNSAGASQEQFNKTLESLQSKLAQLKNAWNTFLMGLANNEAIKFLVDLLSNLIGTINKLLEGLDGVPKSIASLAVAIGGLSLGRGIFNKLTSDIGKAWRGEAIPKISTKINKGLTGIVKGAFTTLRDSWDKYITKGGLKEAFSEKLTALFPSFSKNKIKIDFQNLIDANIDLSQFKEDFKTQIKSFDELTKGQKGYAISLINKDEVEKAQTYLKKFGKELVITGEMAEQSGLKYQKASQNLTTIASGCAVAGGALLALTSILEKNGNVSQKWIIILKTVGVALLAFPVVLKIVQIAFDVFAKNVTITILNIPIVGWIAGIITVITSLIAIFVKLGKENSAEAKLKRTQEAAKAAAEAADNAKQAYEDLLSSQSEYSDLQDQFKDLTKNTQEWTLALLKANQQVLELLQAYPILSKYISHGEYGQLIIEQEGWDEVIKQQAEYSAHTAQISAFKNIDVKKAELANKTEEINNEIRVNLGYEKALNNSAELASLTFENIESFYKQIQEGTKTIEELANEYGTSESFWIDNFSLLAQRGTLDQDFEIEKQQLINSAIATQVKGVSPEYAKYAQLISKANSEENQPLINLYVEDLKTEGLNQTDELAWLQEEYEKLTGQKTESKDKTQLRKDIAVAKFASEQAEIINTINEKLQNADEEVQKYISAYISSDFTNLTLAESQKLQDPDFINGLIQKIYPNLSQEDAIEAFEKDFDYEERDLPGPTALKNAREQIQAEYDKLKEKIDNNPIIDTFSKGTAANLNKQMENMGAENAQAYFDAFTAVGEKLSPEEQEKIWSQLSAIKWTNASSVTDAIEIMQEADIDPDIMWNYWNTAVEGANFYIDDIKTATTLQESFNKTITEAQEIQDRLLEGKATQKDIEALLMQGYDMSDFYFTGEGWAANSEEIGKSVSQNAKDNVAEILQHMLERTTDDASKQLLQSQLEYATDTGIYGVYSQADKLGLNKDELNAYATELQKINDTLANNRTLALEVALANTKLNAGLSEIISSYKDWTELIDKNGQIKAVTSDEAEIFNKLKKSVNEMLNTSEDLSDAFWNDAKNIELIKEAAEGSTEAIKKLHNAAAIDSVINIKPELETDKPEAEIKKLIENIRTLILNNPLPDLEPGIELQGTDKFVQQLGEMMLAAGYSVEQIEDTFGRLGFEVVWGETSDTTESEYTIVEEVPSDVMHGMQLAPRFVTRTIKVPNTVSVPYIEKVVSTGSGGGGVSQQNITAGQSNKPSSSSSSSGSSSKPSYWKNPYDELFNLQERINEALREREALERRYQKLLKSSTASLDEIRRGYREQIAHLKTEIELQRQLAQGRLNQIHNLANQYYTDSEGNRRTYASLGVTQYAHYDENTGLLQIDWDRLEQIANDASRTAEGEAAEAYINALQELVSSYEDVRDAIWDIEDQIEDLNKELIESYTSFEDRVMDALIARYEREIDSLEKINETINDATSKMIDNIQKQIDAQRQERENAKTEEEIAQMEARLAYLRQDTSGANSLEIMQLEKDLEEARQNYEDSLIDQALQQMRDDADVAAEQRAQQIQIMREQLEMAKASGELWPDVYALIEGAFNEDGTVNWNSQLVNLLKETEGYNALSNIGQIIWGEEFDEAIHKFEAGMEVVAQKYWDQLEPWLREVLERLGADATPIEGGGSGGGSDGTGSPGGPGTGPGGSPNTGPGYQPEYPPPPPKTPQEIFNESKGGAFPYGLASLTYDTLQFGMPNNDQIAALNWALVRMRLITEPNTNIPIESWEDFKKLNGSPNKFSQHTLMAVKRFQQIEGLQRDGKVGNQTRKKFGLRGFQTGGLADFTGPAWLDGTKTHPEMVLNAQDTQNLIALKDTLAKLLSSNFGTSGAPTGDAYFDIDINADIASDYDVQQLASEVKRQITQDLNYRNVNSVNFIR